MRSVKTQKRAAKYLHELVFTYTHESSSMSSEDKRDLYFKKRNEWASYVSEQNRKNKGLIELDKNGFKVMVDSKYADLMKIIFPKTNLFQKIILKLKKHSYA